MGKSSIEPRPSCASSRQLNVSHGQDAGNSLTMEGWVFWADGSIKTARSDQQILSYVRGEVARFSDSNHRGDGEVFDPSSSLEPR